MLGPEAQAVGAEVTALWFHDQGTDKHWNLLTVVEALAPGQPWAPDLESVDSQGRRHPLRQRRLTSGGLLLNAARCRLADPEQAWALFPAESGIRLLEVGGTQLPIRPVGTESRYPADGMVTVSPAGEAPHPDSAQPLQRVLPHRRVTAHACVQLVPKGDFEAWLGTEVLESALAQIRDWLGVDLDGARELLGATVWSRPNPCLRALQWGLAGSGTTLRMEAYPRAGVTQPPMVVTAWSHVPMGRQPLFQSRWDGGAASFPIPDDRGTISLQVHDDSGRLLEDRQATFLREINIDMKVGAGTRSVTVPGPAGGEQVREVQRWGKGPGSRIGEPDEVADVLRGHDRARERRALQRRGEFVYASPFEADAAQWTQDFVRGLFGKVRERCIVADPYLGADEVRAFALFVGSLEAEIDLITSHTHLLGVPRGENLPRRRDLMEKIRGLLRAAPEEQEVSRGRLLADEVHRLSGRDPMFRPRVTVLEGRDAPPLHDRFLVVDETVYHLGGSLNHLGHRAMAISRVPAPEPVLADLERWLAGERSEPLAEWLRRRGE